MSSGDESDNSGSDLSSSSEYSFQDDDVLEELFDSDEEEEDFAGFNFDLPENMKWENQRFDVDMQPFTLTPGPTINLPDTGKAFDFFSLFFTEEIIGKIVEFTNKNAQKKEVPNWQPVTSEELKAFIAMLIISNDIIVVPRDERYFPFICRSKAISHSRSEKHFAISKTFLLVKIVHILLRPRPRTNRRRKARPLI